MKQLIFTLLGAILVISAGAQTSDKILNELSAKAKNYNSVYAEYTSRLIDKANDLDITQSGSAYVEGEKYNLDLGDYKMVTDGETIWTFDKSTNDCYIDYLEDVSEGEAMTPSKMFTIWEQDFKHEYKETVTEGGKAYFLINLYPNNPAERNFHTIQLYVDKAKMEVSKFVVKGREGNDIIYTITKFTPNKEIPANQFQFDEKKHPGVNMIDNRI